MTDLRKWDLAKILILILLLVTGAFLKQNLWPFIPYDMYTEFTPNQRKMVYIELIKQDDSKNIIYLQDLISQKTWPNNLRMGLLFFKNDEPKRFIEILKELKTRASAKYGEVKSLRIYQRNYYLADKKLKNIELELLGEM